MSNIIEKTGRLGFGIFEVDLASGELYRAGFRVKIQSQPFKVLSILIEQPGRVVNREELQVRIWGRETRVEFDHSLGAAINKVREALGDSAENPVFVETLAKRGYRFIAPVHALTPPAMACDFLANSPTPNLSIPSAAPSEPAPAVIQPHVAATQNETTTGVRGFFNVNLRLLLAAIILTLAVDGVVRHLLSHTEVRILPAHIAQITAGGNLMASFQYEENLAASDSDGVRLFASALRNGGAQLEAISLSDGTATDVSVPREVVNPVLGAVSPDGSRIVVRSQLSRESEQPLWIIPTMGGSAQRVGNVRAHDASWMPDGRILYATGDELYVDSLSDTEPQLYAKLPGRAYWMRWAPDGSLLRFTIIDPITHRFSLWQISPSDRKAKLVLPDWDKLRFSNCCGMWTADGKSFVFQSAQQEETDLWRLSTKALSAPVRLTDGPLHFKEPVAGRSGNRIYFLGTDPRATIECYTGFRHERLPEGWLEQAVRITYSHDGQWVAWTTVDGSLWRSRIDGSERLQLTPPDMKVFLADWSPDSSRLALMARKPDQAWHVYLLPSSGGLPQLAFDDGFNVGDPSWGPDGQTLVFGRLNGVMGKDSKVRRLQILDLRNGHIETVPGSDGLYSPRWSPDGRYIAALSLDSRKVMLFSVANRLWVRLPLSSGADPHWSADSRSLYVHEFAAPNQLIVRIGIPGARIEGALNLVAPEEHTALEFTFSGVTPSGDILVRTRTNSANLYTMTIANSPEK